MSNAFLSILEVDVQKKKNNLRRYNNRELAKSNESKKSGAGTDGTCSSQWSSFKWCISWKTV